MLFIESYWKKALPSSVRNFSITDYGKAHSGIPAAKAAIS